MGRGVRHRGVTSVLKVPKILNINVQSVVNKVQEFHRLLDTEDPDIVGTGHFK